MILKINSKKQLSVKYREKTEIKILKSLKRLKDKMLELKNEWDDEEHITGEKFWN